jgi:Family of unknown function (DUF5372)
MMYERGKSDPAIVAEKPMNNAELSAAEPVEPRAGTKGNADQQSTGRAQDRISVSQALDRIRQVAKVRRKERFTALFHHVNTELLEAAFYELNPDAAAGVDGVTWKDYEAELGRNLEDLHGRLHRGAYRALPSRRRYIPKPDGRQRPLARFTRTAPRSYRVLGSTEVIHPFHPLRGQKFVVLKIRKVSGVETLSLRHPDLGSFAMPREWTDWAPPDAQTPSSFDPPLLIDGFGLLALAELISSRKRE